LERLIKILQGEINKNIILIILIKLKNIGKADKIIKKYILYYKHLIFQKRYCARFVKNILYFPQIFLNSFNNFSIIFFLIIFVIFLKYFFYNFFNFLIIFCNFCNFSKIFFDIFFNIFYNFHPWNARENIR